ncbi:MAG TPA: 4Fe-4S dicluster domain-containing protein [Thiotrichales bacterium]|nr:4Fe-4S dicluster domain-containing protein [Thiotrichales bacterium]
MLDKVFGPKLNPFGQLGAIGYFLYWIVAATGIYLFAFYDTGLVNTYESVEWYTYEHWYHAGVTRSLHRYASDLMVVMMLVHLLREFALDRYRGVRWFSWFTGVPVIWLVYVSGITGYWLVWDKLAQYVAVSSTELLDWLPIFGEPIARNYLAGGVLSSRFFTLLIFLHVAVPLILLFLMWVHIQRISRPRVNPPRLLAGVILVGLIIVSLWMPAVSQGPAVLSREPSPVGLDWFYLVLYPLADDNPGLVWALLAGATLLLGLMPWLPRLRRPKPAVVNLAHCNGCGRCVDDCPYEALKLVPRTDELPYSHEVAVNASNCVSCGICMGACPSSTPFRRSSELATGIDLPDLSLTRIREQVREIAEKPGSGAPRVMVIACRYCAGAGHDGSVLVLPCVAMAPPSLIDFILSRDLAEGVVVAGCAERSCQNRLGVEWTKQRFAGERDPYLRKRVPRDRLLTVWASASEKRVFDAELAAFRQRLEKMDVEHGSGFPEVRAPREPIEEKRS